MSGATSEAVERVRPHGNPPGGGGSELGKDISDDAPMPEEPTAVASENVGKPTDETFAPGRAATLNAESESSPLLCGPILRYTRQSNEFSTWHGSAMVVLSGPGEPTFSFKTEAGGDGGGGQLAEAKVSTEEYFVETDRHFWRFDLEIPQPKEKDLVVNYTIKLPGSDSIPLIERAFVVAPAGKAFNILFHSCNGFCSGADQEYEGPTLWRDVIRKHEEIPFHVMIGGGDQIYSDGVQGPGAPLEEWAKALSGRKRAAILFTPELEKKVDQWYFTNNCDWFNTEPFRQATSQIPSVNIWDDHDIIDGFGSYKERWHRAPVFTGIGEIAWKYMCLFQQHVNPNTTTNPDPSKPSARASDSPDYQDEPSYILHPKIGPYIKHRGISILSSFGKEVSFLGLDCRTDRTLKSICWPSTYDTVFDRVEKALVKGQTKHLIVLLGVPIAYPRLVFFESLLTSGLIRPLRFLNKAFGLFSSQFNTFDESPELLDDLQDHWAAGLHKPERKKLILRLQDLAQRKQVRVTILSGDVHLAAVGRFFSKKSLDVPQEKDHRYIVNVISSAITNGPPPPVVAQVLNQRNKLHHLDRKTDENMMKIFNVSLDNSERLNQTTYPARNFCIIRYQNKDDDAFKSVLPSNGDADAPPAPETNDDVRAKKVRGTAVDEKLNMREAGPNISFGAGGEDALSISLQIEVDGKSKEGHTKAYAFSIPALHV